MIFNADNISRVGYCAVMLGSVRLNSVTWLSASVIGVGWKIDDVKYLVIIIYGGMQGN